MAIQLLSWLCILESWPCVIHACTAVSRVQRHVVMSKFPDAVLFQAATKETTTSLTPRADQALYHTYLHVRPSVRSAVVKNYVESE